MIDARNEDSLGALLDVRNPTGIVIYKDAKLGYATIQRPEGIFQDTEAFTRVQRTPLDEAGLLKHMKRGNGLIKRAEIGGLKGSETRSIHIDNRDRR